MKDLSFLDDLSDSDKTALLYMVSEELGKEKIVDYRPYKKQQQFHAFGATYRERLLRAGNQNGKALKNGTLVLTPVGWSTIESLVEGDRVIAGDGSITRVIGVYPQGVKPLFKLTFDDGATTVCCGEHLWTYQHPQARFAVHVDKGGIRRENKRFGKWSVGDTNEIIKLVGKSPNPRRRVVMPHCGIVKMDNKSVPIDPYMIGLLIGDGCFRGGITFTTADKEMADHISLCLPKGMSLTKNGEYGYRLALDGGKANGGCKKGNPIKSLIVGLGLHGKMSHEKFVPDCYKFNEYDVRLSVLQGLLDTDGSVSKGGGIEFCSVSRRLAEDVVFLVQTFGGKARIKERTTSFTHNGVKKKGRLSFRVSIRLPHVTTFRLQRKICRLKRPVSTTDYRVLHKIEDYGNDECTCIAVDHPDKTFVIEHCIVTHNSFCLGAEAAYHLTGEYPAWWTGRKWTRPVVVWASGETGEATRDNPQRVLLGNMREEGTGAIPARCLGEKGMASGVANLYDYIKIKHISGGWSLLRFKYYAQGRRKWQGPPVDFVWFDEEPPADIYDEGLARTIATGGMVALSFTPLQGMSDIVLRYLGNEKTDDRIDVNMTIDDAEHISSEERAKIIASFPAHEREARAKGIPTLGSGRIFPVTEEEITVQPFEIPAYFAQIGGIDFGWDHPSAGVKMAWDRDNDIIYIVACHRASQQTPVLFASAVKPWGEWLPWAWPHDGLQHDKGSGEQLALQYKNQGLNMIKNRATFDDGSNGVEAGLMEMLDRMQTGRFKVFSNLHDWFEEFRLYHRKDGKVVKVRDDLLSATRYAVMMKRKAVTRKINMDRPTIAPFRPSVSGMGY